MAKTEWAWGLASFESADEIPEAIEAFIIDDVQHHDVGLTRVTGPDGSPYDSYVTVRLAKVGQNDGREMVYLDEEA